MASGTSGRLQGVAITVGSVLAAFAVGAVIIRLLGADPIDGFRELLDGAFGGREVLADTAVKSAPFLLVGAGI